MKENNKLKIKNKKIQKRMNSKKKEFSTIWKMIKPKKTVKNVIQNTKTQKYRYKKTQ